MAIENILALFPGQGSQCIGMGKSFYDANPIAKELFQKADDILKFPLSELCFNGPIEKLTSTEIVQPAILTVSTICYRCYLEKHGAETNIVAVAGHSLGEYSALVAAEAISFEDAVLLVHKRGSYMQNAIPNGFGKMVAVLGKTEEDIEEALGKVSDENRNKVQVANYNAPGQIVMSGLTEAVNEFLEKLGNAKTAVLAVSVPCHSQLMAPAAQKLSEVLDKLQINEAKIPVYCNVTGKATTNPKEIRDALNAQVCGSVQWVSCMQNAIAEKSPTLAVEFGSGSVLSNLLKRIDKNLARTSIGNVEDLS